MIWVGLVAVFLLLLLSTMSFALRNTSRVRLAEQFEAVGHREDLEPFIAKRAAYGLAASVARSAAVLVVLVVILGLMLPLDRNDPLRSIIVGAGGSWLIVLVFGVAIPNAWAKYSGDWLLVRLVPLLTAVTILLSPLTLLLNVFDPLVRRLAGVPKRDAQTQADEMEQEILDAVSEGELHGAVDEEEKEMIESVIELSETRVEEIMTPRTDMVAVAVESGRDAVYELLRTEGHSRIPVYDGTIDNVLGVLYAKDLLFDSGDNGFDLRKMMRRALFIPESKAVRELLREFQAQKVHIAVVLDEYGGTAGLVTIEDILEELVGEIADEYETDEPEELKRIDERTVEVDARMRIDDLNDELGVELPEDEDYETIGGFVFSTLGRIPKPGDTCRHEDIGVEVIAAEPRRITRVRIEVKQSGDEDE